ncbi:MAG: TetR/AcrR family transcriptional regulator [Phycisphaerae bacterium]
MVNNDKRKQIIRVVEKLASTRRFYEITLDEIADSAKIGKGTIYNYFSDKDDLFFQVVTSGFDELCELLERKISRNGSFSQELLKACREIGKFFAARQPLIQMMQSEAGLIRWENGKIRRQWTEKHKMLINAVANLLTEGIAQGAVRSDISAEAMAIFLLGMLRTRATDFDNESEEAKSYELTADLFLNGAGCSADKSLENLSVLHANID